MLRLMKVFILELESDPDIVFVTCDPNTKMAHPDEILLQYLLTAVMFIVL